MELPPVNNFAASQLTAIVLLDAWLSGDRYRLLSELDRVAALPSVTVDDAECDRMEILTGIAREMQAHADLFAPRGVSPRIGVWMDLLDHLSEGGKTRSN
jgi:hypothetical protein